MTWTPIADLTGKQGPAGSFQRGLIPTGSNINGWNSSAYEGAWVVNSTTAAATITGLPLVAAGTLMNYPGIGSQFYMAYGANPTLWFRGVNNVSSGSWGAWENLSSRATLKDPALVPDGTNLNNWYLETTAGEWAINSTTSAQTMSNLPVVAAGRLINRPHGISSQLYISYGADPGMWFRAVTNVVTKAWSPWSRLNSGGGSGSGGGAALEHEVRADTVRKSMGYKIGTGGRGVFMLRLDDYPQDLATKVLPIVRANHIPFYFAATVRWVEELQSTPWSTIQSWCLNDGGQIWGHSWSHSAAASTNALKKEIIESADYFEKQMPRVRIPGWVMPGTGIDDGPYGGYNGKTDEDFFKSEAGQMILSRYGIVNAARTGKLQPMGGQPIGQSHDTMDQWTVAVFKANVQAAIDGGYALSVMLHPGNLDGTGYMTTAQFQECMEWVAQERAGGRLMTLTGTASAVLDRDSNDRNNLLPGAFNGNAKGWSGWILNSAGNMSSSGTTPLTTTIDLSPAGWARGSTREIHALVHATTASVVRLTATSSDLNATTEYSIPANTWTEIRKYITVPLTGIGTLNVSLTRVSGGVVQAQQINLYAA